MPLQGKAVHTSNATNMIRTKTLAALFAVVGLFANWTADAATLAPASVTFADTKLSTASAPSTLTFTNNELLPITINAVTIGGTNGGDYSKDASSTCNPGTSVAANATCTVKVIFTPQSLTSGSATRSGMVTVTSSSLQNGSLSSTLSGKSPTPVATVSKASLAFADQAVNTTSAAQTYTLSNGGGVNDLTGVSIALGVNPSDFAQTNDCGNKVVAGSSCTISVSFTPTATGARNGSVVVQSANNADVTTQLSGNGVTPPMLALSPTSLMFASQTTATTSAAQVVTLSNNGQTPLTVSSIVIGGSNTGDFSQTNTCSGGSVAAGSNCTINVSFTPTTTGARSASVLVSSNGGNGSVALSGTGTAPNSPIASLSPTSLNFANQTTATASSAQVVTLSNTGNAPMTVNTIVIGGSNAGDFAQTNSCSSSSPVAAGGNCTISVTFTPATTGTRSATLAVTTNGGNGNVALSGTGISPNTPAVTLTPASLTFAPQSQNTTSAPQTVTVSNSGNAPLNISTISTTGSNPGDFGQTNNCSSAIAPNGSCTINVSFTPTAAGSRSATLSISSNAASSPNAVTLNGTTATSSKTVTLSDGRVVTLSITQGNIDFFSVAATPTSGLPSGVTYPVGFFNFSISGIAASSAVTISYALPTGSGVNTYVKCGTTTCAPVSGTSVSPNGSVVTFTITDNDSNDSDGRAGFISDPGAPAFNPTAVTTAVATTTKTGAMGLTTLLLLAVPALLRSRRRKLH
jgi:hypothetical protein